MTNPLQLLSGLGRRLLKRDSFNSAPEGPASTSEGRGGPWAQAWTRLRHKKVALGALIVVVLLYGVGALAPLTAPRDYRETPSTNLEELPGFQGLVMSPNWSDDSTLYNYTPVGVFRSENAGGSWTQVVSGLGAVNVDVLVPVPSEAPEEVVYAGTPQGVFVSQDGASSWASANVGLPDNLWHQSHRRLTRLPRGRDPDCRLVRRPVQERRPGHDLDKRQQWLPRRLPAASHVVFSPAFAIDATVFATVTERKTGSFRSVEEIYRSTDGGVTWTQAYEGRAGTSRETRMAISPAFARDGTLYVSTSQGLLRSRDRGQTWDVIDESLGSHQVISLLISPDFGSDNTIFANTSSLGIYRSVDGGESWDIVTTGLSITKAEGLAVSPNFGNDATLFAGTVDGGLFITTNGGDLWTELASTDLIQGPSIFNWPPSFEHPLGTDRIGRDMLSRVIYGIRTTVIITLASVLTGSLLIGVFMGAAAGYFGRRVDTIIMRTGDIFLAFPGILLIILIAATVKPRVVEWTRGFEDWSGIDGIVRSGAVDYFVVFALVDPVQLGRHGSAGQRPGPVAEGEPVRGGG